MTDASKGDLTGMLRRIGPALLLVILPSMLLYQLFAGCCLLPANLLKDIYPWRTANPNDLVPWNVLQFDGITQFYPWRLFAAETWHSGYVPLWNPHQFCGTPFLANGQSAVLYPPNMLFLLMPVKFAFGWSAVLHLAFTGIAAYFFFRRAGECSRWAALIGAACWQMSTWQISWLALPTFLDTSAWLPLALLSVYGVANRPSVTRSAGLAAIIAIMILAGHLQVAFYCLLLVAAYAAYLIASTKISVRAWGKVVVVAAGLIFLMTAAQTLPTIELSRNSVRSVSTASAAGYQAYVSLAMPFEQATGLFIPGFFGHPGSGSYWGATNYAENAGYIGAFGLLLAMIALFARKKAASTLFFAVMAAIALLIALGTPLNMLLYYGIPGFSQTGSPARILVLWTFCAAFLAAQGANQVFHNAQGIWAGVAAYVVLALLVCGVTVLCLLHQNSGFLANIEYSSNDIRLFAGLLLSAIAILWLLSKNTLKPNVAGPLIFAVLAADLIFVNFGYNPVVAPAQVYPVTPLISWLQEHAGYDRIMPVNSDWSISQQPPTAVLPPNAATVYGLYDLQGYDSLQTRAYKQFANALDGRDSSPPENGNITFTNGVGSKQARAVDAKYVISLRPISGLGTPVYTDGQVLVYQDQAARPIVGCYMDVLSMTATRMKVVERWPFDVAVQSYPGWTYSQRPALSTVIGSSPPSGSPFQEALRPVRIHVDSPGGQVIQFMYQPSSFQIGLYLSLLGVTVLAAITAKSVRQRTP